MKIEIEPVAFVKNTRNEVTDDFWGNLISDIELNDKFTDLAFKGLNEYSHAEILFYFHRTEPGKIITDARHPRGNVNFPETGIFAHRVKDRPNHLGLSIAEIVKVTGKILTVKGLDAINGTPVIDIKPVLKEFLPRTRVVQPVWTVELMKNYWQ